MRFVTLSISMLIAGGAVAADYTLDPTHTYPHFAINHLGFSTMHGRFDNTSGKMTLDLDKGTGSVEVSIEATSVNTGFQKRDDHLRSDDFLRTKEFPAITFKSTAVKIDNKKTATVTGDLTMVGVTKPVTLAVDSINCGVHPMSKKEVCGFNATTAIKRSDFGVKYGLPAVGDDMQLTFEIEAVKN